MKESMHKYMKVGLIHFMAYPATMGGEGPVLETVRRILEDDYFDALELTHIEDKEVRAQVAKLVNESGAFMTFGAQPCLLRTKQNVNSLDEAERQTALANLKDKIDEAYAIGAQSFAFLSGKYEDATREQSYKKLVESCIELCQYAKSKGDMPVNLEVFDYDVEKCSLIGPSTLAKRLAEEVRETCGNFGLMVDLSHIPQIHETIRDNLLPVAPYICHAHMGNAVMTPGAAAYGDQHPRFGFPNSCNGVDELAEYLRVLMEIGYLQADKPRIVSFEVKPWGDEDPEMVIANAKRTLNQAWAKV
ncbi:TIM barrel protein [Oscillospiraceae bacterium MB08-C2-2]|nr:TIM barrel protein [Oscillospiraceae bacterium MB08-C2-2]